MGFDVALQAKLCLVPTDLMKLARMWTEPLF